MKWLGASMLSSITQWCTICSRPLTPRTIITQTKHFSSTISSIHYPQIPNQWSGLQNWRQGTLNHDRVWGPNGPDVEPPLPGNSTVQRSEEFRSGSSLAEIGAAVLSTADPLKKSMLSHLGYCRWRQKGLPIGVFQPPAKPARPPIPKLVCNYLFCLFVSGIYSFFTPSLLEYFCIEMGKLLCGLGSKNTQFNLYIECSRFTYWIFTILYSEHNLHIECL